MLVMAYKFRDGPAKKGVIRLSTDVNIKFFGSTTCHESNVWKFKYDKNIKQYAVMMGGVEGNPGPDTLDNWFKIEKTKDGYKFVYCPSVCSTCKVKCKDLGIVLGVNGMRRLAVSKDPLSVIFYK
ncbi:miraculin-like protein [Tanacetum coccineum]